MTDHTMPCAFPIPADYRREFILKDSDQYHFSMTFSPSGIHVVSSGTDVTGRTANLCLHWIEQCIDEVRKELGV